MAKGTGSLFEAAKLDNSVIHVPVHLPPLFCVIFSAELTLPFAGHWAIALVAEFPFLGVRRK